MPETKMTSAQTAELLRRRPAVVERDPQPEPPQPQCEQCGGFLPEGGQFAPNACPDPSCGVLLPVDPDDKAAKGRLPVKPKAKSSRPWRTDRAWIEAFCDSVAGHTKALLDVRDKQIAELRAEIEALKAASAAPKLMAVAGDFSMSHRNAGGEVIAELWQRDNIVTLRIDGKRTTEAIASTEAAKRLLAKFESMAP